MSVVTKTGDKGMTGVLGRRVAKDDLLIEVLGEIDELMAVVAVAGEQLKGFNKISDAINTTLYLLSGYLSGYSKELDLSKAIELIESDTLRMEGEMEPLHEFLKAGEQLNVWLNWVRVVTRRVERRLVKFRSYELRVTSEKNTRHKKREGEMDSVLIFINRLSDYFFILARTIK